MKEFTQCVILLVEDRPLDAERVTSSFEPKQWGCDTVWVKDGEEALDYLFCRGAYANRGEAPPVLMLLDWKMQKLHGIDVLREVKADERTRRVPVVVMTSSNEDSDVTRAYNLGANSYVVKPLHFTHLEEVRCSAAITG